MFGRERVFGAVEAEAAAGGVEETVELFGEDALAAHAFAPVVGVEFAAVECAQAIDDAGFFCGGVIVEPFQENVFDGEREAGRDVAGPAGAGFGGGGEDGGHFVIGETGNDGRDHDAGGNAGGGKFANGAQASSGARGARFEFPGEIGVEGRDGDVDEDAVETREFGKDVEVAGDEGVFGDDEDWVAKLGADFEAGAGEAEVAFGGLVAVGGTAHGDGLRLPFFRGEFAAEEFGRAEFDKDLGFEIEAAAPAEVFVIGAGEAVGAAVLAAPVTVKTVSEADVGAVVFGEEGFGGVVEELRARGGAFVVRAVVGEFRGGLDVEPFETVGGIDAGAASGDGGAGRQGRCVHPNTGKAFGEGCKRGLNGRC